LSTKVGVIGLGYVGLPLSCEFAHAGLDVVGIEIDQTKADTLNAGKSYILDVPDETVSTLVQAKRLRATTDFSVIKELDAVCICVPTPLRKSMDPDISYIVAAVEEIAKYLHKGLLIVLESTTYPGTTEEVALPRLQNNGLKVGEDFFLAFSPERVDPGNTVYNTRNTPKVIGGVTPHCTKRAAELYGHAVDTVVPVSRAGVAEMVKLLENTFRAINIGMVNELAIMCDRLNIDVWEVINAAKTKPFGFMPFYPGPGLGGHCIPIDPLYLSWKLKTINYTARFIELASTINSSMPEHVITKINDALNEETKSIKASDILILGVAYKRDVSDVRESPALDIIGLLARKGANISYADPYVPTLEVLDQKLQAYDLERGVGQFDCVVIITDHSAFDYTKILPEATLIFDTRNVTADLALPENCTVHKL
jgi:UDP-N-acetyl-D-glucosamine dehydrogenase